MARLNIYKGEDINALGLVNSMEIPNEDALKGFIRFEYFKYVNTIKKLTQMIKTGEYGRETFNYITYFKQDTLNATYIYKYEYVDINASQMDTITF